MLTIHQLEYTTLNHRRRPISTVTGANNLIVLGLRRWFGVVDSSCWIVNIYCRWFKFSSEEPVLTEISTVTGATIKLLAPVTVDISVSTGSSELN
jgi:hypothetical protein